jgi:hypothetical protein
MFCIAEDGGPFISAREARATSNLSGQKDMVLPEKFRTPRRLLTGFAAGDTSDLVAMHRDSRVAETLGGVQPGAEIEALARMFAAHWDEHAGMPHVLYRVTARAWQAAPVAQLRSTARRTVAEQAVTA